MTKSLLAAAAALMGLALGGFPAGATNFSFTGNFAQDDDVQFFTFTADGASTVRLISYGYGGGTQANGHAVARGGLDPILALFDSTGALVGQDDDADSGTPGACGASAVNADPVNGLTWDTCLDVLLPAGSYSVSIQEYENFAIGPNLSDGFTRGGQGNFTDVVANNFTCGEDPNFLVPFHDSSFETGCLRDSHWAFDILNVSQAAIVAAPEPGMLAILGLALGGVGLARRRRPGR